MKRFGFPIVTIALFSLGLFSCSDDDNGGTITLDIPSSYTSANFEANVATENTVANELSTMTTAVNDAEAQAVLGTMVSPISYPSNLESITLDSYATKVNAWLVELVSAANSPDAFQTPAIGETPVDGQTGGILGKRLLDEFGLELEQMVEKGSFGAALYNHALTVVNGIKNGSEGFTDSGAVDRLVEIYGADVNFDPNTASASADYAGRRSNQTTETGAFYDIRDNLITAKAAMEAGSAFDTERDAALDAFLLNWEKSNFATVIYYCNAAKTQLTDAFDLEDGQEKDNMLGDAMHAYAEGVGFSHGFRGLATKQITDAQIDAILANLLAVAGENPESYRFLNEPQLLAQLDDIIASIQSIYGFTDEEVSSFFVNNPS